MKKKTIFIFLIVLVAVSLPLFPQAKTNEIGLIFLEPTGFSIKIGMGDHFGICGAVGKTLGEENTWRLHTDFLIDLKFYGSRKFSTSFYAGFGGRYELEGKKKFGIRFPLGIDLTSEKFPVLFFAELIPILEFTPSMLYFRGAVGMRLRF